MIIHMYLSCVAWRFCKWGFWVSVAYMYNFVLSKTPAAIKIHFRESLFVCPYDFCWHRWSGIKCVAKYYGRYSSHRQILLQLSRSLINKANTNILLFARCALKPRWTYAIRVHNNDGHKFTHCHVRRALLWHIILFFHSMFSPLSAQVSVGVALF